MKVCKLVAELISVRLLLGHVEVSTTATLVIVAVRALVPFALAALIRRISSTKCRGRRKKKQVIYAHAPREVIGVHSEECRLIIYSRPRVFVEN